MNLMKPWTWWARSASPESKASEAGPIVAQFVTGQAVWTGRDYGAFAREGYQKNAIVYRCIQIIAQAAADVGLLLQRRGSEVIEHPLLDLLARPAPMVGGQAFFEAAYSYLLIAGNEYLETVGPDGKPPRELWNLRPDRTQVIAGPTGYPQAIKYEMGGRKALWPVDPITGMCDVIHIKRFHPANDWYGLSPIEPAAIAMDLHNASSEHNKSLLDNGARPSGAMVFKPVTMPDGTVQSAPPSVIEAAEKQLTKRHSGPKNAGRPMVLGGLIDWLEMSLSPKDMDYVNAKSDAAREICDALGVPHILLVPGESTYANREEANLELTERTIIPLVSHVVDALNAGLVPRFGDGLKLVPDLDSISALEPRRVQRRKSVTDLLDADVIDNDEAREALAYGARPNGALRKVDAAVLKTLVDAVSTVGITPLARYMRSVRLVDPKTTDEEILQSALDLIEGDGTEGQDGNNQGDGQADDGM